jgi:hypothetical protein
MSLSLGLIAVAAARPEDVAGRLRKHMDNVSFHFQQVADTGMPVPSVGAPIGGWVLVTDPQRAIVRSRTNLGRLARPGWAFILDADESLRAVSVAAWNDGRLAWHLERAPHAERVSSETKVPREYVEATFQVVEAMGVDVPDLHYFALVRMFTNATGFQPGQPGWWEQVAYRPLLWNRR